MPAGQFLFSGGRFDGCKIFWGRSLTFQLLEGLF